MQQEHLQCLQSHQSFHGTALDAGKIVKHHDAFKTPPTSSIFGAPLHCVVNNLRCQQQTTRQSFGIIHAAKVSSNNKKAQAATPPLTLPTGSCQAMHSPVAEASCRRAELLSLCFDAAPLCPALRAFWATAVSTPTAFRCSTLTGSCCGSPPEVDGPCARGCLFMGLRFGPSWAGGIGLLA